MNYRYFGITTLIPVESRRIESNGSINYRAVMLSRILDVIMRFGHPLMVKVNKPKTKSSKFGEPSEVYQIEFSLPEGDYEITDIMNALHKTPVCSDITINGKRINWVLVYGENKNFIIDQLKIT